MTTTDIKGREVRFYYRGLLAITPHDENFLTKICQGIRVNVSGTVHVQCEDGSIASLFLNAGQWEPGHFVKVFATGTDADLGIYGNPMNEDPSL